MGVDFGLSKKFIQIGPNNFVQFGNFFGHRRRKVRQTGLERIVHSLKSPLFAFSFWLSSDL